MLEAIRSSKHDLLSLQRDGRCRLDESSRLNLNMRSCSEYHRRVLDITSSSLITASAAGTDPLNVQRPARTSGKRFPAQKPATKCQWIRRYLFV